jgi:hypothetical protein
MQQPVTGWQRGPEPKHGNQDHQADGSALCIKATLIILTEIRV